jgi:hypothetical protein
LLGEVLSRPDEFAYAAIFDVAGPAWMIPVAEWTGRRDINEITSTRSASGRGRALVGWQMGEWSRGGWPAWPYGYYLY